MKKTDVSDSLVHLISADTPSDALVTLRSIIAEGRLRGGTGHIKGGYRCVCFCEAPLTSVAEAMSEREKEGIRYQPFGVMIPKKWAFEMEGRPVIYQRDSEFRLLDDSIRFRHVRYEPTAFPPIDFTWEREWRVRTDELVLDQDITRFIVPDRSTWDELVSEHEREQFYEAWHWSQVLGDLAWAYQQPFPWGVQVLELNEPKSGNSGRNNCA